MQFERLKKNYRKQIIIGGLILVCITSAITITTTRAKYKLTEDIPLVRGNISYKESDMRIMAVSVSEDGTNYTETNTVPTSGYNLNTTKSICKIAATDTKDEEITIEYKEGKVNILGLTKKGTKCYLYFDKKDTDTVHVAFGDIEVNRTTPDFSKAASTDEGVYKVSDGMYGGYSYYWRGAATNNYIKFGGFCWRIIRINGDGSMRLIYDGSSCHANGTNTEESIAIKGIKYNSDYDRSEYVGYTYTIGSQRTTSGTSSTLKSQNETWYNNNLTSQVSKIADGKYCNDRNTASGYSWSSQPSSNFYYVGYDRSGANSTTSVNPTLSCSSSDIYTLKIGAITMDEVIMAGGKWDTKNTAYYLYNGQSYWSMSPYHWYFLNTSSRNSRLFIVYNDGRLNFGNVGTNWGNVDVTNGVRPVINLKSDTKFQAGGNGTLNNPYIVA